MDNRKIIRTTKSPRMEIKVPQDIIATSAVKDSSHCMIAEAIAAAVPHARYISVDLATIRFTDLLAGVRYVYLTPRTAQIALLAFDQGEKPEPFSFRLEGAHVLKTGNARKAKASLEPGMDSQGTKIVPTRVDGKTPPRGPLYADAPRKEKTGKKDGAGVGSGNHTSRVGRRRTFGLRAIIK
jgi:hypothetical protein